MKTEWYTKAVDETARAYRDNGYQVHISPNQSLLPEELGGYRPDLIAVRKDEHVAVEVLSKADLAGSPELKDVARQFRKVPGWRFDIAVVQEPEPAPTRPRMLALQEARRRLSLSKRLLAAGDRAAALLLIWTALEAALRQRIGEVAVEKPFAPIQLLKTAQSDGVISEAERTTLEQLVPLRNAIVHGQDPEELGRNLVEAARQIVKAVFERTRENDRGGTSGARRPSPGRPTRR